MDSVGEKGKLLLGAAPAYHDPACRPLCTPGSRPLSHQFRASTELRAPQSAVLALEAFRLMNAGSFWVLDDENLPGPELVPTLLRLAAKEYERAVKEELPHEG